MSRYAQNTAVSSERSKAEIESTLRRYGADQVPDDASRPSGHQGKGYGAELRSGGLCLALESMG